MLCHPTDVTRVTRPTRLPRHVHASEKPQRPDQAPLPLAADEEPFLTPPHTGMYARVAKEPCSHLTWSEDREQEGNEEARAEA